MINYGDLDEKAINTALAQWDEGVNNRFLSQDALKMSTPTGQAAYKNVIQGVAQNNPLLIDRAIASNQLPLSTLGKAASAASDIRQTQLANNRYEDNLAWRRNQVNEAKDYAFANLANKKTSDVLTSLVQLSNANGALGAQVVNGLRTHGYDDFRQLSTDLTSPNEATRLKAQSAWNTISPVTNLLGIDADTLSKIGLEGFASGIITGKLNATPNNAVTSSGNIINNNNTGQSNIPSSITEDRNIRVDPRIQNMQLAQAAALQDAIRARGGR